MKKISKVIIVLFISMSLICFAISCKKNNNNTDNTAYGQLTELEKNIFDVLASSLSRFNSPTEVKVVKVCDRTRDNIYYVDIKLQGKNSLGGTISKWYELNYKDYTINSYHYKVGLEESYVQTIEYSQSDYISCARLNRALTEYWE